MTTSLRYQITAALLLAAALPASAAGFDCSKAKQNYEKAICEDKALSALDDKLATTYRDLLNTSADTALVRTSQREWNASRGECMLADKPNACLAEMYKLRINTITLLTNAVQKPDTSAKHFELAGILPDYVFAIRLLTQCKAADECTGPALVQITRKGSSQVLQTIAVPDIRMHIPDGKPLANSNAMYDYGGVINGMDYNLDGKLDFAIQTGNSGPYSQPSYDIFLNESDAAFKHSPAFTLLSLDSLNSIDVEGNQLVTTSKSGCCIHYKEWHNVVNNKPVPVRQLVLDSASDEKYDLTITNAWKNGKWQRVSVEKDRKSDYCEEELWETVRGMGHTVAENVKFACQTVPGNKKQVVLATALTKGKADTLLVILGRIGDGKLMASYLRNQPYGGKITEVRLMDKPVPLAPGVNGVEVLAFIEQGNRTYAVATVLRKDGDKLVPVLDNLLANFGQSGAMRLRYLTDLKPVSEGSAKLTVHETIQESASKPAVTRDVPLTFDGTRYLVPPDMQYKP